MRLGDHVGGSAAKCELLSALASRESIVAVTRVDRQQEVALILKGSSLEAEAAGDSKFRGQAGR
jgi:hypothetical protein